jgi:putative addiction module component (TIGR02574 family)
MPATIEAIFQKALTLSEDNRVWLAERLLESVPANAVVVEAQATVVRRRIAEMDSGRVKAVSGPEILQRIRSRNRSR